MAIDLSDNKLAFARELGATDRFNARDPDTVAEVKAATGGGVDYALESAGSVGALDSAYQMTRRGGTTVAAGLPAPTETMSLAPVSLVSEERTLKGSYIGTSVPGRDIPRYIELYQRGRLPVDRLMSGTVKQDELNDAFDQLHAGEVVRQVVLL